MKKLAKKALLSPGKNIPIQEATICINGTIEAKKEI